MKGLDGFIPKRLTEAREARGLRKTNLAKMAGISDSQISKYESGNHPPGSEALERLSDVLRMPVEYFFSARTRPTECASPIYYRSMSSATKLQRSRASAKYSWLQDMYFYLQKFVEFPEVNLPDLDPPSSIHEITPNFIEEAAEEARRAWNASDAPISNITRMLETNGCFLGFYDLDASTLDGFSQWFHGRPYIVINTVKEGKQVSASRIRFSLCHELGHLLMHKNIKPESLKNTEEFRKLEKQAHRFSAAFIFPQSAFLEEIGSFTLSSFKMAKPRWKLAISSMIFRAEDIGLIDDDAVKRLRRAYGSRKWSRNEPWDEIIEPNYPELVTDAIKLLLAEKVQTKQEILQAMSLNRDDIEEIASLEKDLLKDNLYKLRLRSPREESLKQNTGGGEVIPFGRK